MLCLCVGAMLGCLCNVQILIYVRVLMHCSGVEALFRCLGQGAPKFLKRPSKVGEQLLEMLSQGKLSRCFTKYLHFFTNNIVSEL